MFFEAVSADSVQYASQILTCDIKLYYTPKTVNSHD